MEKSLLSVTGNSKPITTASPGHQVTRSPKPLTAPTSLTVPSLPPLFVRPRKFGPQTLVKTCTTVLQRPPRRLWVVCRYHLQSRTTHHKSSIPDHINHYGDLILSSADCSLWSILGGKSIRFRRKPQLVVQGVCKVVVSPRKISPVAIPEIIEGHIPPDTLSPAILMAVSPAKLVNINSHAPRRRCPGYSSFNVAYQ
jgi:hypothetical protein